MSREKEKKTFRRIESCCKQWELRGGNNSVFDGVGGREGDGERETLSFISSSFRLL